ncbi:MAG: hypothetical protein IT204_16495 [Fimbriimonadaceae bacterium]|nr:hypothetical protein [Fimbriimonadaceae bacterium]
MRGALLLALAALPLQAADYYVAAAGDDSRAGTAPELAWATLARVNAAALQPGDRVLFRRGDTFRGNLVPVSGAPQRPVTYGAWGMGAKPRLLGSVELARREAWQPAGPELWQTAGPQVSEQIVLRGGSGEGRLPLTVHTEAGAAVGRTTDGGWQITASGTASNHFQLILAPFTVRAGQLYQLQFRARADRPVRLPAPALHRSGPPYTRYARGPLPEAVAVGSTWTDCRVWFPGTVSASDARLTFHLGGDRLPAGSTVWIDDLALREASGAVLSADVGNLIFDAGPTCGVKRWSAADLRATGDFWYDPANLTVLLRSERHPAERWRSIEAALMRHIIEQGSRAWVIYEDLCLLYGAAHGIGGANTAQIIARRLDIGYIGGGAQVLERRVRYGNGIEFWHNAHDHLVEQCRFWEIYDAALTNQSSGGPCEQRDIVYRDNVIWNSEYSFEYWNRPADSHTARVRFIHNTCLNAGGGWGHAQRPDPSGRHLCFYDSPAAATELEVTGNLFVDSTGNGLYAPSWKPAALRSLRLDQNLWWQPRGPLLSVAGQQWTQAQFGTWPAAFGCDQQSQVGEPRFRDPRRRDYRLEAASPGAGWGARGAVLEGRDDL